MEQRNRIKKEVKIRATDGKRKDGNRSKEKEINEIIRMTVKD